MTIQEAPERRTESDLLSTALTIGMWIVEHSSDIGRGVAEFIKGVTNVKKWVNRTDFEVEVWKLDGGYRLRDHYRVPPRQTGGGEMWIPWADNDDEYADHHAVVRVGDAVVGYIWQSGPAVRFNTADEFVPGGVCVPGAAGAGGDRIVVIDTDRDGRVGFAVLA